jgi:hypothetical protein
MKRKLSPIFFGLVVISLFVGCANLVSYIMVVVGWEPNGFFLGGNNNLKLFNFCASIVTCYLIFNIYGKKFD